MRGDKAPLTYSTGEWPYGAVLSEDAPIGAHYGLVLARRLDTLAKKQGLSHRALSGKAGLSNPTVGRIVRGELYPDLATLARLESALGANLYPAGLHLQLSAKPRE
ncbi:multiprotein-bridging factor 1 family protein [Streptomyces sp. NPDC020883]|uniref:multiprotein-bridging factor 1 family protein n=1 Tax=Streptomyces sp. NPDC020883 TaxID=3365099 RepID=UPI003788A5F6